MFDKLIVAEQRYEELSNRVCDPEVISDPSVYRELMRELKNLTPLVETFREYTAAKTAEAEAKELLDAGGLDADFRELAESEMREARESMAQLSDKLKVLLL
ncbi:MAG: PCRF domain-containing protein, partial [Clostridia bacterium]|nr:PCRF domain-containing protein [Clostridia bacterium]